MQNVFKKSIGLKFSKIIREHILNWELVFEPVLNYDPVHEPVLSLMKFIDQLIENL